MRRALAALAAGACVLAAGCGGGGAQPAPGPDPASVAPPGSPLFAEATVTPTGDQRTALHDALSKLLSTDDPGGFIADQIQNSLDSGKSGLDFKTDIEPWLGPRAGFFLENFANNADGAFVAATTDAAATQRTIDKAAAADKTPEHQRTYRGVSYQVDAKGNAAGIVGDFFVAGTETAFKDAVDASDGHSLADNSRFSSERDATPADRFAFAYLDPGATLASLTQSGQVTTAESAALRGALGDRLNEPVTVALSAASDHLALQVSSPSAPAPSTRQSELLAQMPGDSWLAFAVSDIGQTYAQVARQGGVPSLQPQVGFDLGGELERWAGDVAGYVRGSSILGLGGAVVIETTDEQASSRTLAELQAVLARNPDLSVQALAGGEQGFTVSPVGVPIQFEVVQRDGKVVAGLGSNSVDDALSPSTKLGDQAGFDSAVTALGEEFAPSLYFSFPGWLQLADSTSAASDPDYERAKPYLEALDYLIVGIQTAGNRDTVRAVLGLREAPSGGAAAAAAALAVLTH